MVPTVMVHGSDGRVMAPFGSSGLLIEGKRERIRVIAIDPDETIPYSIREALVGIEIDTIFTSEDLGKNFEGTVPSGARLAYVEEVIEVLETVENHGVAVDLREIAPSGFDMYVFQPGTFELLEL